MISRSRRSAYSARSCFSAPLTRMASRRGRRFSKPCARHVFEVGVGGVLGREHRSGGTGSFTFSSLTWQRWAISHVRSSGVFEFAEQLHHFVARLQVEIGRAPAHAVGVVEALAGLDAHQDFVRARVLFAEVVRVVGGDEREAGFAARGVQLRGEALVLLQVMVLNFEEEILLAEDVGVCVRQAPRIVVLVGEHGLGDVAAQAGRHADQSLGMRGQQVEYRCAACSRSRPGRRWKPA